jgi:hypothetical protein
MPDG